MFWVCTCVLSACMGYLKVASLDRCCSLSTLMIYLPLSLSLLSFYLLNCLSRCHHLPIVLTYSGISMPFSSGVLSLTLFSLSTQPSALSFISALLLFTTFCMVQFWRACPVAGISVLLSLMTSHGPCNIRLFPGQLTANLISYGGPFLLCPISIKKLLYLTLVHSKLTYCSQLWQPSTICDIIQLEQISEGLPNSLLIIIHFPTMIDCFHWTFCPSCTIMRCLI